jgi:hypothetical protein
MASGMKKDMPLQHDMALFDTLLAEAKLRNPEVRRGSMFGSPALFLGRRMIGCVFGPTIGLDGRALARHLDLIEQAIHFAAQEKQT